MGNLSMRDEIRKVVEEYSTNTHPSEQCTIIRNKGEGYADIKITSNNQILLNIPVVGEAIQGDGALLVYVSNQNPIIITSPSGFTKNTIIALGLGLFKIRDDGILYVELPVNVENFFEIKEDGILYVTLPDGASNDYHLEDDGILYYNREEF